jgi:predicted HAD superfamily Cof-like phosphohydrolase
MIERTQDWFAIAGQMTPLELNPRQVKFYIGLQLEEMAEKLALIYGPDNQFVRDMVYQADKFKSVHTDALQKQVEFALKDNPQEFLDADMDLIWVTIGAATAQGADVPGAWSEVDGANWEKFIHTPDGGYKCIQDGNGKIKKPEGWQAPDHAEYIHHSLKKSGERK